MKKSNLNNAVNKKINIVTYPSIYKECKLKGILEKKCKEKINLEVRLIFNNYIRKVMAEEIIPEKERS